jgi:hypothetical protein
LIIYASLTSVSGRNEENEVTSRNKIVVAVADFPPSFPQKALSSCLGIIIDVLPQRHSIERHVCIMIQILAAAAPLSFFITVVVAFAVYAVRSTKSYSGLLL